MIEAHIPSESDTRFLSGGGELGALIRAHDWASSPLGLPETWPRGLKTTVRLMLSSGHPMFIWWGPDLIQFYNDPYRRSLGADKHPQAVGQKGRDCWPEIWPIIGPQIEQVLSGRGSTWHENQLVPIMRNGRLEDVYWTYSYNPIDEPTAPNGIGGVLVICQETTRLVMTEQALVDAAQRQQRMFEQAPGFIAILKGPDHIFEFVNNAYIQLAGERDFIGKAVQQVFPELEGQGFLELLDTVYQSGERHIAQRNPVRLRRRAESPLELRHLDFIYAPVTDERGAVTGIFVEGFDSTERVIAEQKQKMMLDELNHRVKNTLSTVQSIASQTLKTAKTPQDARAGIETRLLALAATHDLLTQAQWGTTGLTDVLQQQLRPHGLDRFDLSGPDVSVPPRIALSLGMAIHELATNAVKYGALSAANGRVGIAWQVTVDPSGLGLNLRWVEIDGPPVSEPKSLGFGSRLISFAIQGELEGELECSYKPDGFEGLISIPLPDESETSDVHD
jgi:two-component sensor histidine kinase